MPSDVGIFFYTIEYQKFDFQALERRLIYSLKAKNLVNVSLYNEEYCDAKDSLNL